MGNYYITNLRGILFVTVRQKRSSYQNVIIVAIFSFIIIIYSCLAVFTEGQIAYTST